MGKNFSYKRHHLLQVLDTCRAWANFTDAYNYISNSGAVEAYLPGLTQLHSWGLNNLDEVEAEIKRRYKEYE